MLLYSETLDVTVAVTVLLRWLGRRACLARSCNDFARIGWPDWKRLGWLGQLHCFSSPSLREWTWSAGSYRILGSCRRVGSHYHLLHKLDSVACFDALHCSPVQVVWVCLLPCCLCCLRCLCCLFCPAIFVVMILLVHAIHMPWYHIRSVYACMQNDLYKCARICLQTLPCMIIHVCSASLWWNKTKLRMTTTRQASPRTEAWRTSSVAVRPSWNMVEFPCWPPWDTSHQPLGPTFFFFFNIPFLFVFFFKQVHTLLKKWKICIKDLSIPSSRAISGIYRSISCVFPKFI